MITSLLWSLVVLNTLSLCMYSMAATTMMSFTLIGAVALWMSTNVLKILYNFKNYLLHFCPTSSPLSLNVFLVVIELISTLARPVSLSVRMIVNITCSHLMLFLCGLISSIIIMKNMNFPLQHLWKHFLWLIPISLFVIMEFGVVCIQAYVFSTLTNLYLD